MFDFHSIVVRVDGASAHIASNSHSGAVEAAGWRENDQMADLRGKYFVEAEWGGLGDFPGPKSVTRGDMNEKQRKLITNHYTALQKLLADPASHAERLGSKFGLQFQGQDELEQRRGEAGLSERC